MEKFDAKAHCVLHWKVSSRNKMVPFIKWTRMLNDLPNAGHTIISLRVIDFRLSSLVDG